MQERNTLLTYLPALMCWAARRKHRLKSPERPPKQADSRPPATRDRVMALPPLLAASPSGSFYHGTCTPSVAERERAARGSGDLPGRCGDYPLLEAGQGPGCFLTVSTPPALMHSITVSLLPFLTTV